METGRACNKRGLTERPTTGSGRKFVGREFFFFNDTATTEIYTLSLHDALPIYQGVGLSPFGGLGRFSVAQFEIARVKRSEEHTSELQSQSNFVCRLLLEKKKLRTINIMSHRPARVY